MEIEVDGTLLQDTSTTPPTTLLLEPGQSRDVKGSKIRVHAPKNQTVSTSGTYERL